MTDALTCCIHSILKSFWSPLVSWTISLHLKVLFSLWSNKIRLPFNIMRFNNNLCLCFYLSHTAWAGAPCRLLPTDRDSDGGGRGHRGPQQAEAEARRPLKQSAPHWLRRRLRDQRGHQRGLQPTPLQRLVNGPTDHVVYAEFINQSV